MLCSSEGASSGGRAGLCNAPPAAMDRLDSFWARNHTQLVCAFAPLRSLPLELWVRVLFSSASHCHFRSAHTRVAPKESLGIAPTAATWLRVAGRRLEIGRGGWLTGQVVAHYSRRSVSTPRRMP